MGSTPVPPLAIVYAACSCPLSSLNKPLPLKPHRPFRLLVRWVQLRVTSCFKYYTPNRKMFVKGHFVTSQFMTPRVIIFDCYSTAQLLANVGGRSDHVSSAAMAPRFLMMVSTGYRVKRQICAVS